MELNPREVIEPTKIQYRIMNVKTGQLLDANEYFVKSNGTVWKFGMPCSCLKNQDNYKIIVEDKATWMKQRR